LVQAEPNTAHWTFKLADCLAWEADVFAFTGQVAAARETIARSEALFRTLLARDPANRRWLAGLLGLQLKQVAFEGVSNPERTRRTLAELQPALERLVAAEPQDRAAKERLMRRWRLEAATLLATHDPGAREAAAKAVAIGQTLMADAHVDPRTRAECAQALALAGRIEAAARQAGTARESWLRALDVLAPHAATAKDCRLLDPQARVLEWLGRREESQVVISRLREIGYVPLEPWPAARPPDSRQ
jgi:hypothetical protein